MRNSGRLADRERCAANLRQIGQAMLLYSNDNRNQYPDSIATLVRRAGGEPLDLSRFICASSDDATPASADEVAAGKSSYLLIENSRPSSLFDKSAFGRRYVRGNIVSEEILAIERPGHHGDAGVHVLFADGRVEPRRLDAKPAVTWVDTQDDAIHNRPLRWLASQPVR